MTDKYIYLRMVIMKVPHVSHTHHTILIIHELNYVSCYFDKYIYSLVQKCSKSAVEHNFYRRF